MKPALQNNYTNMDQSKRLLELGVPANSADCYFFANDSYMALIRPGNGIPLYPCWSVGRLIEIMGLCYDFELPSQGAIQIYRVDIEKGTVIDVLISDLERFISRMDFSKLER